MEERLDTIIELLADIRDALRGVPEEAPEPDGPGPCPCAAAMGAPIANCPMCRGRG